MKPLIKLFAIFMLSIVSMLCFSDEQQKPWLDSLHENITDSVNDSALWFDEFFMLDQNSLSQTAVGEARIQLGWNPRSRDLNQFESRIKLRYKLPNLKNRVDLVVSDYDDEQPDNLLQKTNIEDNNQQNRFSLALQWKAKPDSGLSHRIGVGRRLQVFVRSRYRTALGFGEHADIRMESSIYYYSGDGFGAELAARYGYVFNPTSMLRFNNHFYYRDKSKDWLWQHSLQHLIQIDEKNALIYGVYFEGLSQPNYHLEEYLVSSRWRINALREWLFFELEPYITWRKDEAFSASYGIGLRLEGYFGQT